MMCVFPCCFSSPFISFQPSSPSAGRQSQKYVNIIIIYSIFILYPEIFPQHILIPCPIVECVSHPTTPSPSPTQPTHPSRHTISCRFQHDSSNNMYYVYMWLPISTHAKYDLRNTNILCMWVCVTL